MICEIFSNSEMPGVLTWHCDLLCDLRKPCLRSPFPQSDKDNYMSCSLLLWDSWDWGQPDLSVNSGSTIMFALCDLGRVPSSL